MVSTMFLFPLNNAGLCRANHDTDSSNFLPKSIFTIVLKFKKDQLTITIVIA